MVTGYATFANGGFKIEPYLLRELGSINSDVLFEAKPKVACQKHCEGFNKAAQVIEPRVSHIMDTMLSDAIRKGTGTKALRSLKRDDLRGKTGTTNDADIWFSGFTPDLVATAWAGFSDNSPVGNSEWGSTTPLETWIDFMESALPDQSKSKILPRPDGIVSVKIDPVTGLRTSPADPDGIFEIFRAERAPTASSTDQQIDSTSISQQIF